jgi:hypothetical protein
MLLARALFERQAGWIRALTWVRDPVMATVGVKSSRAIGAAAAARGSVIGYFPLLSKSAGELVVGEDDRSDEARSLRTNQNSQNLKMPLRQFAPDGTGPLGPRANRGENEAVCLVKAGNSCAHRLRRMDRSGSPAPPEICGAA